MIVLPFSIPVIILPFYWVLVGLIGWLNSQTIQGTLIWIAAITFSLLVHEYGHALTARWFGQRPKIYLEGLGGVTRKIGPEISLPKEFLVVLNGPLSSFVLYFLSLFAAAQLPNASYVVIYFLKAVQFVNLFWTVLNLIPVLPLDGGQLMRIFLEGLFGIRGTKSAFFFSLLVGALAAVFFLSIQQIFISALFFMFAFDSYRRWQEVKSAVPEDTDKEVQYLLNEAEKALASENFAEAVEKARSLRYEAPKGVVYVRATEIGAQGLAAIGELKEAYNWLLPLKNRLSPCYLSLLQQIACRVEEWQEAIESGKKAFDSLPSAKTALLNARASAMLGRAKEAIGWLKSAKQIGTENMDEALQSHVFDSIRSDPEFQKFIT